VLLKPLGHLSLLLEQFSRKNGFAHTEGMTIFLASVWTLAVPCFVASDDNSSRAENSGPVGGLGSIAEAGLDLVFGAGRQIENISDYADKTQRGNDYHSQHQVLLRGIARYLRVFDI
jgi:hypothetical protein